VASRWGWEAHPVLIVCLLATDISLNMKEFEKGYIAGAIDGEGNIAIGKRMPKRCINPSYTCHVKVSNTDRRMVDWIHSIVGKGSICSPTKREGRKQIHNWTICDREAEEFLLEMLPYFVIKKEQALIVLNFRDTFVKMYPQGTPKEILSEREKYFKKLQELHD
jgi:hypothetical protein